MRLRFVPLAGIEDYALVQWETDAREHDPDSGWVLCPRLIDRTCAMTTRIRRRCF
jgi:hypothetical protein